MEKVIWKYRENVRKENAPALFKKVNAVSPRLFIRIITHPRAKEVAIFLVSIQPLQTLAEKIDAARKLKAIFEESRKNEA